MYAASFDGCWAKVERANEHRDRLDSYIREEVSIDANRPTLAMKFRPKTSEYVLYVDSMPEFQPMLKRVGVLIGDFVHNLRGALDHLVYQLALVHLDGQLIDERRIQMPIDDSPMAFINRCRRGGWLDQVSPRDWAILKAFQPYDKRHLDSSLNFPFHPLALLRDLSNRDKHRLLAEVWVPTSGFSFPGINHPAAVIFIGSFVAQINRRELPRIVKAEIGTQVARVRWVGDRAFPDSLQNCGSVSPHILLGDLDMPVVRILDRVVETVTDLVKEFDASP